MGRSGVGSDTGGVSVTVLVTGGGGVVNGDGLLWGTTLSEGGPDGGATRNGLVEAGAATSGITVATSEGEVDAVVSAICQGE